MTLRLHELDVSLQKKPILRKISCDFESGKMIGIIGPNGSGKSTLLKTMATIYPYENGHIHLYQQPLKKYSRKQVAKAISYVPQDTQITVQFPVRKIIEMGRHIHQPLFTKANHIDYTAVQTAMKQTNITHLQDENVQKLSGGQRQLVMIAKALAQNTPIILLDEPIASLDVYYQLYILHMLHQLRKQNKTIIIVLHDLNLAARFCDELLLLDHGKVKQFGPTKDVLTPTLLKEVYDVHAEVTWNNFSNSIQLISDI